MLYKAWIYVKSNKQDINSFVNIYTVILTIKSFKIVIILITKYDLKTKQFNIINAFFNVTFTPGAPPVYYKLPFKYE